jgi:type IV fimbrial biogenesis protein FimT
MVTLAVAAVLIGVVIPTYTSIVQRGAVTGVVNAMVAQVHFARSEATKRNVPISLCPSVDSSSCNTSSPVWSPASGSDVIQMLVFTDLNSDGDIDTADGEEVLRSFDIALQNVVIVPADSSLLAVRFSDKGYLRDVAGHSVQVDSASLSRCISIPFLGRPEVLTQSCS